MKKQKASDIDKRFDEGEDVLEYFDLSKTRKPNEEIKRINVDFPIWMVESLDRRARHLGVNRQSVIKMWIAEKLEANTQSS